MKNMKYPANQYEKRNQPNRKMNKRMNTYHRHVSVLKKQESEKHKKILASLVIKQIQVKTVMTYFTLLFFFFFWQK